MPQVIITPAFANIRARAKEAQYGAYAEGIKGVTDAVSSVLLDYSLRKQKEDTERLVILKDLVGMYGSHIGQPALQEMDSILKRKKLGGLPKDPTTKEILPPPSSKEELLTDTLAADPEAKQAWLQKQIMGKSPVEMAILKMKADSAERLAQIKGQAEMIKANAAMIRARMASIGTKGENLPSAFYMSKEGSAKPYLEGVELQPGEYRLTNKQAQGVHRQWELGQLEEMRSTQNILRDAETQLKKNSVAWEFMFGPGQVYLKYLRDKHEGRIIEGSDEARRLDKGIDAILSEQGLTPQEKQSFWKEWLPGLFGGLKEKAPEYYESLGAGQPSIPGKKKLKSGIIVEEVPD